MIPAALCMWERKRGRKLPRVIVLELRMAPCAAQGREYDQCVLAAMEVRVREAQGAVEKLRKELQEKNSEADKLHSDIQEQTRRNTQYISENGEQSCLAVPE